MAGTGKLVHDADAATTGFDPTLALNAQLIVSASRAGQGATGPITFAAVFNMAAKARVV